MRTTAEGLLRFSCFGSLGLLISMMNRAGCVKADSHVTEDDDNDGTVVVALLTDRWMKHNMTVMVVTVKMVAKIRTDKARTR